VVGLSVVVPWLGFRSRHFSYVKVPLRNTVFYVVNWFHHTFRIGYFWWEILVSKFVDEVAAEITLGTDISLDVADIVDSNVTEFNKYEKAVDMILDSGRVKGKQEASDYVLRELSKEYKDACTVIDKLSSKVYDCFEVQLARRKYFEEYLKPLFNLVDVSIRELTDMVDGYVPLTKEQVLSAKRKITEAVADLEDELKDEPFELSVENREKKGRKSRA
jgi:hypothetical protein